MSGREDRKMLREARRQIRKAAREKVEELKMEVVALEMEADDQSRRKLRYLTLWLLTSVLLFGALGYILVPLLA